MKITISILFTISLIASTVFAWDNKITHPKITRKAVYNSADYLTDHLKKMLDLHEGLNTILRGERDRYTFPLNDSKPVQEWIEYGAEQEDIPMCRASNHFHNPLLYWDRSGLTDYDPGYDRGTYLDCCILSGYPPSQIDSNIFWSTGYVLPGGYLEQNNNDWDWESARRYYYTYLTGKDGSSILGVDERINSLTMCFQALGQTLHLLQDMAVPAHTRNDFSYGHTRMLWFPSNSDLFWLGNRFEMYVKQNSVNDPEGWFDLPYTVNLDEINLTNFWDTEQYNGDSSVFSIRMDKLGLAEYANLNFVSSGVMFTDDLPQTDKHYFPFPMEGCTNFVQVFITPPENVNAEDGKTDQVRYLKKISCGEQVDHFVVPSYFAQEIFGVDGGVSRKYKLDEKCFNDYAKLLIPRAIGYSSALLEYFFRGEMQIRTYPILYTDTDMVAGFRVNIKNTSKSQEFIQGSTLNLSIRYTPIGGNPDGSEDIFLRTYSTSNFDIEEVSIPGPIGFEEETDAFFYLIPDFNQPVTRDIVKSCNFKMNFALKGMLGEEPNAVIGKVYEFKMLFDEEWLNDLNGDQHPVWTWEHVIGESEPQNGSGTNVVVNGRLEKENIRNAGYKMERVNESLINLVDSSNPQGIKVTPTMYVHFFIEEMSQTGQYIDESSFQDLNFVLRDGNGVLIFLRFSTIDQHGPVDFWNDVRRIIVPGVEEYIENIYDSLIKENMSFAEPLYLEEVLITQQMLPLESPSPEQQVQRMVIDSIQVIDDKVASDEVTIP
jgi:hypothetical protein